MSTGWFYVLGEAAGEDVKFGYTSNDSIRRRLASVQREQTTSAKYVVLTGVRATKKDEAAALRSFGDHIRTDKGHRREYLWPVSPVVEYINWLRSQWFATPTGEDSAEGFPVIDADLWLPGPGRTRERPTLDDMRLVQSWELRADHLGNTAWTWMVDPEASIQDYFTPPEIIQSARAAMGGIDLDAASHWIANQRHRIPDYFDINRSAFEHRWYGRVWLNPPYGDNAPWWAEIVRYVDSGDVEQICILSPMWSFTTGIARPITDRASALVLLSPTPKFWGNKDGKEGANHPHGVLYIGHRPAAFNDAFRGHGIPVRLDATKEATNDHRTGRTAGS